MDRLVVRMERGEFYLIVVGRALLGDPRWVSKIHAGDTDHLQTFEAKALAELV